MAACPTGGSGPSSAPLPERHRARFYLPGQQLSRKRAARPELSEVQQSAALWASDCRAPRIRSAGAPRRSRGGGLGKLVGDRAHDTRAGALRRAQQPASRATSPARFWAWGGSADNDPRGGPLARRRKLTMRAAVLLERVAGGGTKTLPRKSQGDPGVVGEASSTCESGGEGFATAGETPTAAATGSERQRPDGIRNNPLARPAHGLLRDRGGPVPTRRRCRRRGESRPSREEGGGGGGGGAKKKKKDPAQLRGPPCAPRSRGLREIVASPLLRGADRQEVICHLHTDSPPTLNGPAPPPGAAT